MVSSLSNKGMIVSSSIAGASDCRKRVEACIIENLSEPKTLDEIKNELTDVPHTDLKTILQHLTSEGTIIYKEILDCSVYWKKIQDETIRATPQKTVISKSERKFTSPLSTSIPRKPSPRVSLPFKSPALSLTCTPSSICTHPKASASTSSSRTCNRNEAIPTFTTHIQGLESELEEIEKEISDLRVIYSVEELKTHIDTLHEYNEMKDTGQVLLGKLAEVETTTTAQLYSRYGLKLDS